MINITGMRVGFGSCRPLLHGCFGTDGSHPCASTSSWPVCHRIGCSPCDYSDSLYSSIDDGDVESHSSTNASHPMVMIIGIEIESLQTRGSMIGRSIADSFVVLKQAR